MVLRLNILLYAVAVFCGFKLVLTAQNLETEEWGKPAFLQPIQDADLELPALKQTLLEKFLNANTSESCRKETLLFLKRFTEKKRWALEMFDAMGKLPSGLIWGNAHHLGEFDQCVQLQAVDVASDGEETAVAGKYCLLLVDIQAKKDTSDDIKFFVHRIRGEGLLHSTFRNPGHFIPRFSTINFGICIPSGCSGGDAQSMLDILKYTLIEGQALDVNISASDEMCFSSLEQNQLPLSAKLVLALYSVIITITIVGTVMDTKVIQRRFSNSERKKSVAFLISFSVTRNLQGLVASKNDDLPSIHGIRALCSLMLYFAHKTIVFCMTPYSNRHTMIQDSQLPLTAIFRSSMIYTDTFLLLSGVLSSYNFCKEFQKTGRIAWINRLLTRYFRLTPAFLAIILYYAYLMEHVGTGPQWSSVIKANADLCKKNSIWNLLYIHNIFPFEEMCVTQSHQLALDMQLYLITPALIYLLYYHHLIGLFVFVTFNVISTFLRYMVTLQNKISLVIHFGVTVEELYKTANLCYSQTLHRATPYLFGIYAGYVLHKYKSSSAKNISWVLKLGIWTAMVLGGGWPIWYLKHMSNSSYKFDAVESATYAAVSPIIWAISMSLFLFTCCFGWAEPVNRILSSRFFVFLSKISYPVFLSQFAVFFYRLASVRTTQFYRKSDLLVVEEMSIVLCISLVITLLFDCPVQNIRAILIRGNTEEKTTATSSQKKDTKPSPKQSHSKESLKKYC